MHACRYVVRKIRAAASGEEQPEKPKKTSCSISKTWKGEESQSEGAESRLRPALQGGAKDQQVEQCGS
ncbi:hypothetical protein AGOR_G00220410 [Albula goreensis]|uniref:Uncharacterized protein n=1 Tax=Albula goreensis TaxID=1534307 RepID=A0A8T3CSG0_9TELE|nr:hypothetical protein AGOR_G00220410 [Albula goreensis]